METDAGITGVGEISRRRHQVTEVERFGEWLVGGDPFETEWIFGAGGRLRAAANDIFTTTMTGGFNMACWDIKGKHLGVPVHDLLGGKLWEEVWAYANGWDFDARSTVDRYHGREEPTTVLGNVTEELASRVEQVVNAVHTALVCDRKRRAAARQALWRDHDSS